MAPRKKPAIQIDFVMILLTIGGAVIGAAINMYSIANQVATKPYVDDGLKNAKIYTDERSSQILKEAIAHSDLNRQTMLIEMGKYNATIEKQGGKLDMLLESVRQMQTEGVKRR